jgi:hypothetical protein
MTTWQKAALLVASIVLVGALAGRRLETETSVIQNDGANLMFDVDADGTSDVRMGVIGDVSTARLGVGTVALNNLNMTCVSRDVSNDRPFADKDCNTTRQTGIPGSNEDYVDGRTGMQTFYWQGSSETQFLVNRCLLPGGDYADASMPSCNLNVALPHYTILFPANVTVTAQHITCSVDHSLGFTGETATFAVRWVDASDLDVQAARNTATTTCTTELSPDTARVCVSSTELNDECEFSRCAMAVRLTAETISTASNMVVRCNVFYEMSG